jgi:hypothetical protein
MNDDLTNLFKNLGDIEVPRLTVSKIPLVHYLLLKVSAELYHRPLAVHLGILLEQQIAQNKEEWLELISVHASIMGVPPEELIRDALNK